jgi:hypothetical protein
MGDLDSHVSMVLPQMLCSVVCYVTAVGVGHLGVRGAEPLFPVKPWARVVNMVAKRGMLSSCRIAFHLSLSGGRPRAAKSDAD